MLFVLLLGVGILTLFLFQEQRQQSKEVFIEGKGFTVRTYPAGAIEVLIGKDRYIIESSFSEPGKTITYNRFERKNDKTEFAPFMKLQKKANDTIELETHFEHYSLFRSLKAREGKIEINDNLKNRKNVPVGIRVGHTLSASPEFQDILMGGGRATNFSRTPENPTIFIKGSESGLGVVAQDSVFRLQLVGQTIPSIGEILQPSREAARVFEAHPLPSVRFGVEHFALDSFQDHTFEWTLYPFQENANYFAFINKVRDDWNTNFTVFGPFDFFDVTRNADLIHNAEKLKIYLERKQLGIVALAPWLDYDHFSYTTWRTFTRKEYREVMQKAMKEIKKVDPNIQVIGSMQSNLVSLPEELVKELYVLLPEEKKPQGMYYFSDKEMNALKRMGYGENKSLIRGPDGKYFFEIYYRPHTIPGNPEPALKIPLMAIASYAEYGNAQFEYWMDQARFIIEEVGLDGVYIDQFSLALGDEQRYTFHQWDGVTVDMDPATGNIVRRYTDGSLVGIGARKKFAEYILSKDKLIVANTHAAVKEMQSVPIQRFFEGGSGLDYILSLEKKGKPPYLGYLARGHLSSPIALGYFRPERLGPKTESEYVRIFLQSAVIFLRNGLMYYYYYNDIPNTMRESADSGAGYEPLAHMYPLTPISLGEGFIEGRERIVTTVSRKFSWREQREPSVVVFDLEGKKKQPSVTLQKSADGWSITILLDDWEEIAIIE